MPGPSRRARIADLLPTTIKSCSSSVAPPFILLRQGRRLHLRLDRAIAVSDFNGGIPHGVAGTRVTRGCRDPFRRVEDWQITQRS